MSLHRVIAVVTAALLAVLASATTASASTTPDTWPQDEFSALEWIGLYIGGAVALIAVIWILAAAANAKIRHHVVTPPSTEIEKAPRQDLEAH